MNAALEPDVDEAPVLDVDEAPVRDVPFAHDAVLLPAALGAYRVEGAGELIRCRLPENAHPDGSQRASSGPA